MKYLIVHTHPNPASFCSAITAAIRGELSSMGKDYLVRDLYQISFDPALKLADLAAMRHGACLNDVRKEREYVSAADMLIFVFPVFFNNLPAMLKGYLDRIFSLGFGYVEENFQPKPLLTGKTSIAFSTAYSSEELSRKNNLFESVNNSLAFVIKQFCGIEMLEHKFFTFVPYASDQERKGMLQEARETVRRYSR